MKPLPKALAVSEAVAPPAPILLPETYTWFGDLMMLTKARLSALVLVTTGVGFGFGSRGGVDWFLLFRVMFGTAFVAASASVLNQVIERKVDRLMGRTRERPLPAGRMHPGTALGLGVLLAVAGIIYLVNRVSPLCGGLAALTLATYVALYTPLKRKSAWCVTVGAISGAIPPLIGWAAARSSIGAGGWILFGVLFFWQMPHFLALAWMYRDEYAQGGFFMLRRNDIAGLKAAAESLVCALALAAVTLLPLLLRMVHPLGYIPGVFVCDALLLGCAVLFLAERNRASARRLFLASILYLPLLLGLLLAAKA